MRADLHQHIWTEPLLDALATRDSFPFVRTSVGVTTLHCRRELPYVIERPANRAEMRTSQLCGDGLDRAVIALSSPVGIEALPRAEARHLIDAHLAGVGELPAAFAAWGPLPLADPDPNDVDNLLDHWGCAGISLPAGALAGPARLHQFGALLDRVQTRGAPLLVHPGPAPDDSPADPILGEPLWWRALTDYVAQMQAAWLTFITAGRREHPNLVVVFAMLAGGAPLLTERLATRGGPAVDLHDPRIYYETSSYGPDAIAAVAERVGAEQLVYGSDRPVVEPVMTAHDEQLQANAARLIALTRAKAPA